MISSNHFIFENGGGGVVGISKTYRSILLNNYKTLTFESI
jgi:hypothetical protein